MPKLFGINKNLSYSYMFIDTENSISINSLDYDTFQTWNFYSSDLEINSDHDDVHFEKTVDCKSYSHYAKSWRQFSPDDCHYFLNKINLLTSCIDGNNPFAILADSQHFQKTLITTLGFFNSDTLTFSILSFLENFGIEKNCGRIQTLTKERLSSFNSLEQKISFY